MDTFAWRPATTKSQLLRFFDPDTQGGDVKGRTLKSILARGDRYLEDEHDYIQWVFPVPEQSKFSYNAPTVTREVVDAFRSSHELKYMLNMCFVRMVEFYGFIQSSNPEEAKNVFKAPPAAASTKTETETETESNVTGDNNQGAADYVREEAGGMSKRQKRLDSAATIPSNPAGSAESSRAAAARAAMPAKLQSLLDPLGYHIIRGPEWHKKSRRWTNHMDHNHLRISRILRCLRIMGLQKECDAFFDALCNTYYDPKVQIGEPSMMFWRRAVEQPLHIAPDGTPTKWLKQYEEGPTVEDDRA
jgi:hypothetical protein